VLRGGPGRLPQAVRPRGRLGGGHRGGRAARDEHVSRAREADAGRARADRGREMNAVTPPARCGRRGTPRRLRVLGPCAAPPIAPRRPPVWLLLVLAAVLFGRPVAARAADVKLPPVTHVTLENGLRLIVAELHEVPLVEFYVMIGAGSAQDPEGKEGLASLT